MTLLKEASEIRNEVAALPKRGRKYTKAMRARVLAWLERALESGMREVECQEALGISAQRFMQWQDEARLHAATVVPDPIVPRPTASTSLVPVSIRDDLPFGPLITFSAPSGYRIEGLTLDQAIGLLRLFG